jgi:SAM-dependent methyltransferase
MKTDTAYLAWNKRWATAHGRQDWLVPEPDVVAVTERLADDGRTRRVLDLGCGVGRHALHLARLGFETYAIDLAEAGLAELARAATVEHLAVTTGVAPMTAVPFPDAFFDYVLSFNVIYHGDPAIVATAVGEIRRVLRPGAIYQGTMLSKRNAGYGIGTEVAPNTFVSDAGDDKCHPHFYCSAGELIALFDGFELLSLDDKVHANAGSWHWHFTAERV